MPSTHEPPNGLFARCPWCLRAWDLFPVYRCPNCGTVFCGSCDEEERPEGEPRWRAGALAGLRMYTCPACTLRVTRSSRIGTIRRTAAPASG